MFFRHSELATVMIATMTACGGSEPNAVAPMAKASNAQIAATPNPKPDDDATRGNISFSSDVKKACGLSDDEAFFAFDSAKVRAEDKKVFRKVADCFATGALKGRHMSLTGHADPRGTDDYNLALGGRRADNVKAVIVAEDMPAELVTTTSRGEMDATGTDEASWAKDRFVEVGIGK